MHRPGALIRPARGQFKRSGVPRINWQHPLAAGLLFYGFDTGAGTIIDLVRNRPGTRVPGATRAPTVGSPWGQGIGWNNSDGIFFASDAQIRAASAAGVWSMSCAFNITGTLSARARPFARAANNDADPFVNWGVDCDWTAQNTTAYLWASSIGIQGQVWPNQAANTFTSIGMVAKTGSEVTGFAQGAAQLTTGGLTQISVDTDDAILFSGGSSAASDRPFLGLVYYGGFWNRPLTDAEMLLLHVDPYCFLAWPQDRIIGALRGAPQTPLALTGRARAAARARGALGRLGNFVGRASSAAHGRLNFGTPDPWSAAFSGDFGSGVPPSGGLSLVLFAARAVARSRARGVLFNATALALAARGRAAARAAVVLSGAGSLFASARSAARARGAILRNALGLGGILSARSRGRGALARVTGLLVRGAAFARALAPLRGINPLFLLGNTEDFFAQARGVVSTAQARGVGAAARTQQPLSIPTRGTRFVAQARGTTFTAQRR